MAQETSGPTLHTEALYTAIFEALSGNSILVQADPPKFTILAATPEYIIKSGQSLENLIGTGVFEAFPANVADPEHRGDQDLFRSFQHVLHYKKPQLLPVQRYDLKNDDGSFTEKHWKVTNKPVFSPAGEVIYIIHTAEDISDQVLARKQEVQIRGIVDAKRKVEESETLFRTMAEGTPVLIAVSDDTGNATYFNKAWTDLTGRPMQQLLQLGWADLIHAEDRDKFVSTYLDASANKTPFTGEFRVISAQGEYRWLWAHGVPRFNVDGKFMGHISACTDITESRINQQMLQTVLEQVRLSKEAAELGTFDMDLEKGSLDWDDRCRILFGISHHNPVTYEKDFVGGLHPEDRARILEAIDQSFNKSISNGDYDVEYRTVGAEDGIIRWVRAKGKVYFNGDNKPVRFIGSVLDITDKVTAIQKIEGVVEERTKELAQANETLQDINRELQRSNQNLEEFAHAASHDLKEPVRKIHFYTTQLKEQLSEHLQEVQARSFSRIENATQRMANLIDDLLQYSHVSHRPMEMESIDLNAKIRGVLEDLELNIQEKKAVVHAGQLPVVTGYRRQMQQLFLNLISNALKYSKKEDPPRISITASRVTENGKEYDLIAVKDNGIGFDPKYAGKIFQMFTRLHGKTEYSGTGVGLSIVKKVVENHNGIIKVDSKPGEGSTFSVYLPVVQ
jgi:PAS domain S-box-containing protein